MATTPVLTLGYAAASFDCFRLHPFYKQTGKLVIISRVPSSSVATLALGGGGGGAHDRDSAVQLVRWSHRWSLRWERLQGLTFPVRSWWQNECICWELRLAFRVSALLVWGKSTHWVSEAGLRTRGLHCQRFPDSHVVL